MKEFEGGASSKNMVTIPERRDWTSPKLNKIGTLSEMLGSGGGKSSLGGDPGDSLKPPGSV